MEETTKKEEFNYQSGPLFEAIKIIMENDRMRSGDILAQKFVRIAIDVSPDPLIANLVIVMFEKNDIFGHFNEYLFV